jgi:hypothetical protein
MTKHVFEVLTKARALIAKPEHWTQRAYARDARGYETENYRHAACFCSIGAIERACGAEMAVEVPAPSCYYSARKIFAAQIDSPIGRFNDSSTHSEVLAAFDAAIVAAKAEGGE